MSNTDSAEDEVRGLWKAQDVPALQPLAQQQLAEHAAKLQGTVSRRNRREVIAAVVIAPVFLSYAWFFPHWLGQFGALLTVVGMGVVVWQIGRRASVRPPPEAWAGSLLAFHRSELVRQRDALRSVWLWYIGPITPGITLFICGRQIENGQWQPWPFVIAALLLAGVVGLNRYAARGLQREIDKLDELTRKDNA